VFLRDIASPAIKACLDRVLILLQALLAVGLISPGFWARSGPQARISVQSNVVSVPTFVFQRKGRTVALTPEQVACLAAAPNTFAKLLPSQPYKPADCSNIEIQGLTVQDFHLFQDGVEQEIQAVIPEGWLAAVRDNMTWHNETSDTPSGIWSSTDLRADNLPVKFWPQMYTYYYNVVYAPAGSASGCHRITVKVSRPDAQVFARDEYCAEQSPSDVLSGTKEGDKLRRFLESPRPSRIPLFLQASAFQMGPNGARVDLSFEFPWKLLNHTWDEYLLWARIGILGEVRRADGALAARFSDLLYPPYWPTFLQRNSRPSDFGLPAEQWTPAWLPTRYETQMDLPPGNYKIKVALSDDNHFGLAETGLTVPQFDAGRLGMSSIILCGRYRDAHAAAVEAAQANFAPQYVPLVSIDTQFTPAGNLAFWEGGPIIAYFEVYEPMLATHPDTKVLMHIRVIDDKTGATINSFNPVDAAPYKKAGTTTIAIARQIPLDDLLTGPYRIEVEATDSYGGDKVSRSAEFTLDWLTNR
jgi:hypothetical protein